MEKPAVDGAPTQFKIEFEYTSLGFYEPIDPARVTPAATNDPALAPFLAQQPTHIVFSDDVQRRSREIIGAETNPYLKARRIFQWVSEHVPWGHAREYSTLECLPQYALSCGHGDCGIETMTFMTFCRFNGIPARWESGWATGKLCDMHDWCEIYLAPYGWVPVDVYQGLVQSEKESEKWFYLGGIDGARFVINTDYAQPLYPAKVFARSEIIDFQRGEVEWRGGNLYFDQWKWDFKSEEIMPEGQKLATESTAK
jgi:transglutaminase-like putative cysteine protease